MNSCTIYYWRGDELRRIPLESRLYIDEFLTAIINVLRNQRRSFWIEWND